VFGVVVAALEVVAGGAVRDRRFVRVGVQRHEVAGAGVVGGSGARVERHGLVALPGEPHAAALGAQQLGKPQAERQREVLLGEASRRNAARVGTSVPGIDDHRLPWEAAGLHVAAVALRDLLALPARLRLAQGRELDDGALADDAVDGEAGVALEVEHGALHVVVVDAALGAGVEAHQVELHLEGQHVVAAERRLAQVEQAVAEGIARLHQLAPGVGAHEAIDQQAALLLEGTHGELCARAEEPVDALATELEALPAQAGLDVEDFFAAVAAREVAHR